MNYALLSDITIWCIAIIGGLLLGSFLNVCIWRIPRGESIVIPPFSCCPSCARRIRWYEHIPVISWLLLKRKCDGCHSPISWRYPIVEIAMASASVLLLWRARELGDMRLLLHGVILAAFLLTATMCDLKDMEIPTTINASALFAALLLASFGSCGFELPAIFASDLLDAFLGGTAGAATTVGLLFLGTLAFGNTDYKHDQGFRIVLAPCANTIEIQPLDTDAHSALPTENLPLDERVFPWWQSAFSTSAARDVFLLFRRGRLPARVSSGPIHVAADRNIVKVGTSVIDASRIQSLALITNAFTLRREAMGFGDVLLMAAIGAFLGWQGAIFVLLSGICVGAFIGAGVLFFSKSGRLLPFGPFLSAAAFVWVLGANMVWDWYFTAMVPIPDALVSMHRP